MLSSLRSPLGKVLKVLKMPLIKSKVVRVMPNTPALVGEGMSALCPNEMVTEKDLEDVLNIFNSFGQTEIVSEN